MTMMHRAGRLRRAVLAGVTTMLTAAALSAGFAASATVGYPGGRLTMVSEPGESSSFVSYYVGEQKVAMDSLTWVDKGHTGKAVQLNGQGQALEIGYWQMQMHTMTFSGWFQWLGAAEGMGKETMYSQRLFTMSRNDNVWLTVMPHARDEAKKDADGRIKDGVYMGFSNGSGKELTRYDFYNPAVPGRESYGLSVGSWHHIAMTMDGTYLKLYIDGRLWFERMLVLGVEEMRNNSLTVGGGRWNDPTLHALVDDTVVYDFAMTADDIARLYQGIDPQDKTAVTSETTLSLPTAPSATTAVTTRDNADGTIFGLPRPVAWLVIGMAAVSILLSAIFSIRPPKPQPPHRGEGGDEV